MIQRVPQARHGPIDDNSLEWGMPIWQCKRHRKCLRDGGLSKFCLELTFAKHSIWPGFGGAKQARRNSETAQPALRMVGTGFRPCLIRVPFSRVLEAVICEWGYWSSSA